MCCKKAIHQQICNNMYFNDADHIIILQIYIGVIVLELK